MKYKLKRDLPFDNANSGEVIWRKEDGKCYTMDSEGHSCCMGYASNLINKGWIEEVKPREFYVEIRKNDGVATDVYEGEKPDSLNMIDRYNYIKVREVIE